MRLNILIVDDEPTFSGFAGEALTMEGFDVTAVSTLAEAHALSCSMRPDVIILDRCLPDGDGLDFLRLVNAEDVEEPAVLVVTAFGNVKNAVDALKLGATDYLTKPVALTELVAKLRRLAQRRAVRRQLRYAGASRRHSAHDVVAASAPRKAALRQLHTVARSRQTPVFITGPSGAGKQVMAEALHDLTYGDADMAPFVEVNCAALHADTMEAELFGRAGSVASNGRATPAVRGMLEMANGGTLFLDEIGKTPQALQHKLLRFLDHMRFCPLGSAQARSVALRVVASSSVEPRQAVAQGQLLRELYHRLAVFALPLPQLRDCPEDVRPYAEAFLRRYAYTLGKSVRHLSPQALHVLQRYNYPGNVRELRNTIERAVILCGGDTLRAEHVVLPTEGQKDAAAPAFFHLAPLWDGVPPPLEEVSSLYVKQVLQHFRGHRTAAAQSLGISYPTLLKRLRHMGATGAPDTLER